DATTFIRDLGNNARGKNRTVGHRYEVACFPNARGSGGCAVANVRKTQSVVAGYTYQLNNVARPQYNFLNRRGGPVDFWIIYDADDRSAGDPERQNEDFPDRGDNHGTEGGSVVFCDGHAQCIKR